MSPPDFDALVASAFAPQAEPAALDALYGSLFQLPGWWFIVQGHGASLQHYAYAHPQAAEGQQMILAYTDEARLRRLAEDLGLLQSPDTAALRVPLADALVMLDQHADQGMYGVHFNFAPDSRSFHSPLRQLKKIRRHLQLKGLY
jgi:hypothetical protein